MLKEGDSRNRQSSLIGEAKKGLCSVKERLREGDAQLRRGLKKGDAK